MSGSPPAATSGMGIHLEVWGNRLAKFSSFATVVAGVICASGNWYLTANTKASGGWTYVRANVAIQTGTPTTAPRRDRDPGASPPAADEIRGPNPEPKEGASCQTCPTIKRLEVLNPGPGKLTGVKLKVTVPEPYDKEKHKVLGGLIVRRCAAVKQDSDDNGGQAEFAFTPESSATLLPGQRFWVDFESPHPRWNVSTAVVVSDGNSDASIDRPLPDIEQSVIEKLLWYTPIVLLFMGCTSVAATLMLFHRLNKSHRDVVSLKQHLAEQKAHHEARIAVEVAKEIGRKTPEIYSQAYNACMGQMADRPVEDTEQIRALEREIPHDLAISQIVAPQSIPDLRGNGDESRRPQP